MRVDVLDGASRRSLSLPGALARIGRDPVCEICLAGDPTVSRVHAFLRQERDCWVVVDNDSRNGVYVNGRRVTGLSAVAGGDRVAIGTFALVIDDEAPLAATVDSKELAGTGVRVATGLSARELEVLRLLCSGHGDQQIAEALFVSVKTVRSHLDRIRDKTGRRRRPDLVRYGIEHGIW